MQDYVGDLSVLESVINSLRSAQRDAQVCLSCTRTVLGRPMECTAASSLVLLCVMRHTCAGASRVGIASPVVFLHNHPCLKVLRAQVNSHCTVEIHSNCSSVHPWRNCNRNVYVTLPHLHS